MTESLNGRGSQDPRVEAKHQAVDEVTVAVSAWRGEHDQHNLYIADTVYADGEDHPLRSDLAEVDRIASPVERLIAKFALGQQTPIVRALEAGFVENKGSWDATDDIENGLAVALARLPPETHYVLARRPEFNRYFIEPGVISAAGLVAVRRHRELYGTKRSHFVIIPHKQGVYEYPEVRITTAPDGRTEFDLSSMGEIRRTGGQVDLRLAEVVDRGVKRSAFVLDAAERHRIDHTMYRELQQIYEKARDFAATAGVELGEAHRLFGIDQHYELQNRQSHAWVQRMIHQRESEVLLPAATAYIHARSIKLKARRLSPEVMGRILGWDSERTERALQLGVFATQEEMLRLRGYSGYLSTLRD